MDEPTDGLDPNQKFEVRGLISRMPGWQSLEMRVFSPFVLKFAQALPMYGMSS